MLRSNSDLAASIKTVSSKPLPINPTMEQLIKEAVQRLSDFRQQSQQSSQTSISAYGYTLADAQLDIAHVYGFANWLTLRKAVEDSTFDLRSVPHHERIEDATFRRAVDLIDEGNVEGLTLMLRDNPDLLMRRVHFDQGNYFSQPFLLEFCAENPIRNGILPDNILDVVRTILACASEYDQTQLESLLELVASGRICRECKAQIPLIKLLCAHGAQPSLSCMLAALGHGEFESVEALLGCGAPLDIAVAAATGRVDDARELMAESDSDSRHLALALAAQHGQTAIVMLLLEAGEDPNRYNPNGAHSHSTPLHQAALAGHLSVVKALVGGGARLDIPDLQHQSPPSGWAQHSGNAQVIEYLNSFRG